MGTHAFPNIIDNDERPTEEATHDLQIQSDEIMISLFELSRNCIKILGIDGTLDFINCGGIDASGMRIFDAIQGQYWWTLWPNHTQDVIRQSFERAKCGNDVEFSAECPTTNGKIRKWAVNLTPMRTEDGTVVGVLCKSRDLDAPQAAN